MAFAAVKKLLFFIACFASFKKFFFLDSCVGIKIEPKHGKNNDDQPYFPFVIASTSEMGGHYKSGQN